MPVCVSYSRTVCVLTAVGALALAGAAQAGDGSVKPVKPNFTFGDGSHGFNLRTSGGAINPGILVGFDPQPDPPGETETLLDITDGTSNTLYNPVGSGPYRFHLF
ncbi:MAG: hypothetical protein Q8S13_08425, partial [Dehalococcoidia bacterium]|nr:hypothetical protein [Dehalococcoidia bacterium]